MNQDELIEKCRLKERELQRPKYDGLKFDIDDIEYVLEDQLRKAIPIIQKVERERIANWLERQGTVWVDRNYTIIEAIRKGKP